jgi:acyl carrier protein
MNEKKSNYDLPHPIIRDYIMENVTLTELEDDLDIFGSGIVNSLFAIELMTFIEKSFDIKVTMDDLDMDNFKTVNAASQFVLQKKEAQHA